MKYFLNHLTAALTVALLLTSTALYSGNDSHIAILDAYDANYTTGGFIATTSTEGRVTITTLQLPNDKAQLCRVFGTLVDDIVVTLDDHSTVNVECD